MLSLFLPVGIIMLAGLLTLAAFSLHLFYLQLAWIVVGALLIAAFFFFDWRSVFNFHWVIWGGYAIALLLIVLVFVAGPVIRNARSWFVIGPFTVQPVEFMKIALIFLYANYFARRHLSVARWQNIITSLVFFAVPAAIAVHLPDVGSAVIFFSIWFGFLLLSGLPARRIVAAAIVFLLAGVLIWTFVFRDYHRARIISFFFPQKNALTVNYSVTQSKIAIGSAGFWGKGFGQGTQTQLGFLSEPSEDFIFAAFIEEWGIFGGLILLGAFAFLIWRILVIGMFAAENFGKFICLGTAMMFGVQFFLNAGSTTGVLPVIGVTFPFLSYGGTSMLVDCFLLAVVNAIRRTE